MTLIKPTEYPFAAGDRLPASSINQLSDELVKAIDGHGGSYTLNQQLTVTGDGYAISLQAPIYTRTTDIRYLRIHQSQMDRYAGGGGGTFSPSINVNGRPCRFTLTAATHDG